MLQATPLEDYTLDPKSSPDGEKCSRPRLLYIQRKSNLTDLVRLLGGSWIRTEAKGPDRPKRGQTKKIKLPRCATIVLPWSRLEHLRSLSYGWEATLLIETTFSGGWR